MPATGRALAAGDITVAHARRLAVLCAPDTAAAFAEAEEFLVGQARSMRWPDFTKACGYWLRHARTDRDPDPDKTDHDHRKVSLHDGLRGTGLLTGELTPTAKIAFGDELDRLERQLFDADWTAAKAVRGDAVTVEHLPVPTRNVATTPSSRWPTAPPPPATASAPARCSACWRRDASATCSSWSTAPSSLPATTADLLDDAVIERIVFDGPSRVLDLGHQRSFVGAARRAVEVVHRTCTGKGCTIRADRCEIDHTLPYIHDGPTVPDNGEPKCRPHHRQRQRAPVGAPRPPPRRDGHDGAGRRHGRPPRTRPSPRPRPPPP